MNDHELPAPDGWRAEWTGRSDPAIAEVAEALEVPTDLIMATAIHAGRVTAMFTRPDDERELPAVYGVALDRDALGILRPVGEPYEIPGMLERVRNDVERDLRRKGLLGDPPPRRRRRRRAR